MQQIQLRGDNIGYAVHLYPGWFGSADGYEKFKQEGDINVKPVADFAPIVITEMDWAPKYTMHPGVKALQALPGAMASCEF
jgi:hypothetical protein